MLSAFILENLAKGGLIRTGQVQVSTGLEPDTQLPNALKTHGLPTLISSIEVAVDEAEEELLHRLARASIWRGRYPVAARYEAMHPPVTVASGKTYSATWFGEHDVDRIEALIDKVRVHVGAVRNQFGARDAAP